MRVASCPVSVGHWYETVAIRFSIDNSLYEIGMPVKPKLA